MAAIRNKGRKATSKSNRNTRSIPSRKALAREKRLESSRFGRRARDKRDENGTNMEGLPGFRKGLDGEEFGSSIDKTADKLDKLQCPKCSGRVKQIDEESVKCRICNFVTDYYEAWKAANEKQKIYFSKVGDPAAFEPETMFPLDPNKPMELNTTNRLQTLEEDRGKIYGDPFLSHQAIGLAWEGVFRNRYHELFMGNHKVGKLFPADLVAEMLAAFKLVRLARPQFLQDSADDAKVYISFSERFRK